ncbi:hypothetical protein ACEWY4_009577 [Coilia grayii]|uniref:DUF4585 domain-containing protein n=1 Tax=Coilia grayii TaxID=363190 RepID=A0ABD1K6W0_9TELE
MSECSSPCDGFEDVCLSSDEEQESEEGDSVIDKGESVVAAKTAEFRLSVVELDGEPAVLLGPIQDYEIEADALLSSLQDFGSETAVVHHPIQQYEKEAATLLSSIQDFGSQTAMPPAAIQQYHNEVATLLSPIQDFDSETAVVHDPVQQYQNEVATLPSPIQDFDSEPVVPPAAIQQYEIEAAALPSSIQDIDEGDSDDTCSSYCTAVSSLSDLDDTPEDETCPPCLGPADHAEVQTPKVRNPVSVVEFDSDTAAPPSTRQECEDKTAEFHLSVVELDSDPAPLGPEYDIEADVLPSSIQDLDSETAVPSIPIQENDIEAATLLSPVQDLGSQTAVTQAHFLQYEKESALRLSPVQDFTTPEDKICSPCPEPADRPAVETPEVKIPASVLEFDSDNTAPPASRQEYDNTTAQLHQSTQMLDCETVVPPACIQENKAEANVPFLCIRDVNTPEDKICHPCPEPADHPKVTTPVPVLESDSDITAPPAFRLHCDNKTAECHRSVQELDSETAVSQAPIQEYKSEADAPLSPIKDFDSGTAVLQDAIQKDENEADALLSPVQVFDSEASVPSAPIQECKNKADAILSSKHDVETPGDKRCSPCLRPSDPPKVKTAEVKIPTPLLKFDSDNTASPASRQEYGNSTVEIVSTQKCDFETAVAPTPIQEVENEAAVCLSSVQDFNVPEDKICPPCPEPADRPEVKTAAPVVQFCSDTAAPPHTQECDDKTAEFPLPKQEPDSQTAFSPAPIQEYNNKTHAPVSSIQDLSSENAVRPAPTEKHENNAAVLSSAQKCEKKAAVHLPSTQELDSDTAMHPAPIQMSENKAVLLLPATDELDSKTALFPASVQQMDCKTAVLSLQSSLAISAEASDSDISYRSLSVSSSHKPVECPVSLNSASASRTCSLTHHVSPVLASTNKTFEQTAHNLDIGAVQTGHVPLSKPPQSPRMSTPSRDIVKVSMTTRADTDTREGFCSPPPSSSLGTILITPEGNQYNRDRAREIGGKMPTEVPPKQGPRLAEVACSGVAEPPHAQPMGGGQLEVGEGQGTVASCRVEQTELSVRDRNRKASASCIPTLTGDAHKSGILLHCYSECILATGQQHQPQSPPELRRWQKQSSQVAWRSGVLPQKVSGSSRKGFSTTQQSSGKNNMGTKLSETDSEVKTLSNLPAKTFSWPDTNYLDVNNLTCRPSTEPCTDSGFNGWAEDNHCFKLPMPFSPSQNNTSACSEASSVECIVVALETQEEVQRGSMKTVPKRQIQLKRKDTADLSAANGNHDDPKPQGAPPAPSRPRDIFLRQHSTPAAFHQESHGPEQQRSVQAVRKQRLQKSLSLDETSSKTKMASCLIKNVLSKKMQHEQGVWSAEVQENAIATVKVQANGHVNYQPAKETSTEFITKMNSSSSVSTQHKVPSHSPPLKAPVGSIKEHISVSSKTQQKPMIKHSFNPLHRALGRAEFQSDSPEITPVVDGKKAEKPIPRDEAVRLPCWSPGEKLSCDSAKGKDWKTSAVISKATGSQACVKATLEECGAGNGTLKQQQQHAKNQPAPKAWEKDVKKDKLCGTTDVPPQKIVSMLSDQEVSSDESLLPQTLECFSGSGKEQQAEKGEIKLPVHFGNSSTHDKLKGIAPVHVVRDVRSLVKNTYNLSFRGSDDTPLGCEDGPGILKAVAPQCQRAGERGKVLGSGDKQRGKKAPISAPVQVEKIRDKSSQHDGPRGGLNKLDTGFTKVTPNNLFAASSCLESSAMEGMASSAGLCKLDAPSDNTKCKHTDRAERPPQALLEPSSTRLLIDGDVVPDTKQQERLDQGVGPGEGDHEHSPPQAIPLHGFATAAAAAPQCFTTTTLLRESFQSPSLTPVLTAALSPAQVLPAYYYKANALSYPAITQHVGTVGFVQGPMILQTSAQPMPSAGTSALVKHVTEDGQRASLNCSAEKRSGQKGSQKQTGNGENQGSVVTGDPKRPSPEAQQYLCGTQTIVLASEGRRSSAGTLYPELGGAGLIQAQAAGPRHLLVDPETGRCFYMDLPQQPQPQRKMLFDPETCQYVEVLLPQQAVPSAVMSPTCAVPLPFPAVYTPSCLPYLQAHAQVLPHPGP